MEEVIALPEEYTRSGYTHKLLAKNDSAFIYEMSKDGGVIAYEVFKRLVSKAGMAKFGGGEPVWVDAKERKPNDEAFGKWAWSISILDDPDFAKAKAYEYFNVLGELKGDLKAFLDYRSPNPLEKHFEVFVGGNKRIIKISDEPDVDVAMQKAKTALEEKLSKNVEYDVSTMEFKYLGEFTKWGNNEVVESEKE